MMAILLPENKTLYHNPFLFPKQRLDEIVGYEPDVSCLSLKPKTFYMSSVNVLHVESYSREHRATIHGDKNVAHVFPKMSKKEGGNTVEIELALPPKLDILDF